MDNLLTIAFEAHNAEKNHHRKYAITLGRDLLDCWTLAIRYGRCGQCCQEKRFSNSDAKEIRRIIRDRLSRRLSAPRRIGCSYRLSWFNVAPGFESTEWLPGDVIAQFFHTSER